MRTHYVELFKLHCLHEYFADGVCKGISLQPTAETRLALERFGCLFRSTLSGATILCATEEDGVTMAKPFDGTEPLHFAVTGDLGQIASVTDNGATDLATPDESVRYFSNVADDGVMGFGGQNVRLLHQAATEAGPETLPVKPKRFVQPFGSLLASAQIELIDSLGNSVWRTRSVAGASGGMLLDLSLQAEGRYWLQIDGLGQPAFYLSNMQAASLWGVAAIYLGGPSMSAVPEACRVVNPNGTTTGTKEFAISLAARRSIWRYYIVAGAGAERSFDSFEVTGSHRRGSMGAGGETIAFRAAGSQTLNSRQAWVFESEKPIPLFERPGDVYEIVLKDKGKSDGVALAYGDASTTQLEPAPPKPAMAEGEITEGPRFCSEVFVYL